VAFRRALPRALAAVAALTLVVGAALLARSVVATQGWLYAGFVSETGQPGAPHRDGYTLGILGLAAALVLLAGAALLRGGSPAWIGWGVAALFVLGGLSAGVSSLVSCTAGCPLPPFQTPTPGDLVHAAASVLGMALCGAAMAVYAISPVPSALRTLGRAGVAVTLPLAIVAGFGLVFVGRGTFTGTAEKALVLVIIAWTLAICLAHVLGSARLGSARLGSARLERADA
jgi:hypothetical protein